MNKYTQLIANKVKQINFSNEFNSYHDKVLDKLIDFINSLNKSYIEYHTVDGEVELRLFDNFKPEELDDLLDIFSKLLYFYKGWGWKGILNGIRLYLDDNWHLYVPIDKLNKLPDVLKNSFNNLKSNKNFSKNLTEKQERDKFDLFVSLRSYIESYSGKKVSEKDVENIIIGIENDIDKGVFDFK